MDLPRHLLVGAHALDAWRSAGLAEGELRGPLLRRVQHGRYTWSVTGEATPVHRALVAASVLPKGLCAVGGWSAAALLGVEWLDGETPSGAHLAPVLALQPDQRARRHGVSVLRSPLGPADVVSTRVTAVPVTAPVRTAFDLARTAPSLTEAVVALDAMARHGVDASHVMAYAANRPGWKGVRQARQASALASDRVRSPAESRLRMLWVLDAGLPQPLVNAVVFGARGERIGEVDLLDPGLGLVGEYDGAPHSDARARAHDSLRQEQLQRVGLTVVRATSVDLQHGRDRMVRRLREAATRASAGPRGAWSVRVVPVPPLPLEPCTEWSRPARHAGVSRRT